MIKETIQYDTLNDETVSEEFYFNFTKLEIIEMDMEFEGGIGGIVEQLKSTQDGNQAYKLFKKILLSAYGMKSLDGKKFIKSAEFTNDFESSPALGELVFSFLKDPDKGARFIEGCLPAKLVAQVRDEQAKQEHQPELPNDISTNESVEEVSETKTPEKKFESYSRDELLSMTDGQFNSLVPHSAMEMSQEQMSVAMQRKNSSK